MNIIDILILVVMGFCLCAGMYKGFLSSLLATGALVGSWFGAQHFYARVADLALSNSSLMGAINTYLEPDSFFADGGSTLVSALGGNTEQIRAVADEAGKAIPFIRDAFENNLLTQAFQHLNINTVAEYFSQTLLTGAFNVLAFILCFAVIYIVAILVINLLDHVFRFSLLKGVDWLVGGIFGLVRGAAFALLLLVIVLPLVGVVAPEFAQEMMAGSKLYAYVSDIDFLNIGSTIQSLLG